MAVSGTAGPVPVPVVEAGSKPVGFSRPSGAQTCYLNSVLQLGSMMQWARRGRRPELPRMDMCWCTDQSGGAGGARSARGSVTVVTTDACFGRKAADLFSTPEFSANIKQFQEGNVGDEPGGPLHSLRTTECNHCS